MEKKQPSEESRRASVYRALAKVKGWEDALNVRYHYWRKKSVEHVSAGSQGSQYMQGKADAWEEIIEIIKAAKSTIKDDV